MEDKQLFSRCQSFPPKVLRNVVRRELLFVAFAVRVAIIGSFDTVPELKTRPFILTISSDI
jgi:hypothetical protein